MIPEAPVKHPHHILQKCLLEAKLSRGGINVCGVNNGCILQSCHINTHENEEEEEGDLIFVPSKCLGQDVNMLIDTGCKLNLISSRTIERLGLKELVEENKMEMEGFPFQPELCIDGHIRELSLTIGQPRCVIDTEKQMLVFGTSVREQVQFVKKLFSESSSGFRDLGY